MFILGRLAFAPLKNGRVGSDEDAQKLSHLLEGMFQAISERGWCFDLFLGQPFSVEFPMVERGSAPLRLYVDADGAVRFPPALVSDSVVAESELGNLLLQCFEGNGAVPDSVPLLVLFSRIFYSKRITELQRQVCWGIAQVIERQLGVSCVRSSPAEVSTAGSMLHLTGDANGGCQKLWSKDVLSANYWLAGQKEALAHLSSPWSCSFDGTRVGGHSVLACAFVFPTNRAFWAPIQDLLGQAPT